MAESTVHVLVACTNRKRARPSADLRLRSVRRVASSRAESWLERVGAVEKNVVVGDLYAGDSWFVARRLRSKLQDRSQLWALSAGFGLVRSDDRIASYAATLSSGHRDSVHRPGDRLSARAMRRRWWSELTMWEGAAAPRPRSVAALAGAEPAGAVIVCAGADYVDAAADDLLRARASLDMPERLLILGAGRCPEPDLQGSWVSLPAKLRTAVGGSLGSLSVRSAERVLYDVGSSITIAAARKQLRRLAEGIDELPRLRRERMTDDQVAEWIALEVGRDPTLSKTAALRRLRDRGLACEQERFGRLYAEVRDALA